jgi:hypothetical protein
MTDSPCCRSLLLESTPLSAGVVLAAAAVALLRLSAPLRTLHMLYIHVTAQYNHDD